MSNFRNDINAITAALRERCGEIAERFLGPPTFRTRREIRWGNRGSFALATAGPKRGFWHDHERGDILRLIERERRVSFGDALRIAREMIGEPPRDRPDMQPRRADFVRSTCSGPAANAQPNAPPRDTQALAIDLWRSACERIEGTPADQYLRSRGIDPHRLPPHANAEPRASEQDDATLAVSAWPPGLRWHAERGLLVVAVNDGATGLVRAAHTVALHPDGTPVTDANWRKLKRTFGPLRGSAVRFGWRPDYEHGRWALAEGCETALAAAQMLGCPCWASLGASNLPNVRPPPWARAATLVADHDNAGLRAAGEAARRFRALGLAVTIIRAAQPGSDLADLAKEGIA